MSKPLLSVIIPVYNMQNYLKKCLETTIIDDERVQYIIVNDGSSDSSYEIIKSETANASNVILINQKNQGLSEARNAGLKLVSSKWVTFVDSDDFMDQFRIQKIINLLEKEDNSDLYTLPVMLYQDGEKAILQDSSDSYTTDRYIYQLMSGAFQIGVWSYLFKTEIIHSNRITFDKGRLFEDKFFLPKYLKNVSNIQAISSKKIGYYYYRMRPGSITHEKLSLKKIIDWYDSGEYITNSFSNIDGLDRKTVFAIDEYKNTILFRAYIDLLKMGQKTKAAFVKNKINEFVRNRKTRLSFISCCKIIITYIPINVLFAFLNGGK